MMPDLWLEATDHAQVLVVRLAIRMGEAMAVGNATSSALEDVGGDEHSLRVIRIHLELIVPLLEEIPRTKRDPLPSALMSADEAKRVAAICVAPLRPA